MANIAYWENDVSLNQPSTVNEQQKFVLKVKLKTTDLLKYLKYQVTINDK